MSTFTPVASLLGGALIGASASALLVLNGRVAGISGIFSGLLVGDRADVAWRALFFAGLLAGGLALLALYPSALETPRAPLASLVVAGLLVGFGTRLGGGCTSGHGVCGISRFSLRSIAATATFMAFGFATASLVHVVLGRTP